MATYGTILQLWIAYLVGKVVKVALLGVLFRVSSQTKQQHSSLNRMKGIGLRSQSCSKALPLVQSYQDTLQFTVLRDTKFRLVISRGKTPQYQYQKDDKNVVCTVLPLVFFFVFLCLFQTASLLIHNH